jgi:hypothetical protein
MRHAGAFRAVRVGNVERVVVVVSVRGASPRMM